MPEISFFIPAYNCAKTIAESVDSIMATNFTAGDELIIVNDCSTDNTSEILHELKEKYAIITIIDHKRNKGGAAARNTAVENAKHGLLFCLDSDNILEKNSIHSLLNFLIDEKADIAVFGNIHFFSKTLASVDEEWAFKRGVFSINDLLTGVPSPAASGNYLFTKNSWVKAKYYTEDLGALDTWAFGFKQLMENCKMVVMPTGHYFHRRGHDSYYIRDALNRQKSVSIRLIKLIIDYFDVIHPSDLEYIFSKSGRFSWFDNLKKRPIRLIASGELEGIWTNHIVKESFTKKLPKFIKYYSVRAIQILKQKYNSKK
jgi:glycosyltransferase involved in cell wall biosynthesis